MRPPRLCDQQAVVMQSGGVMPTLGETVENLGVGTMNRPEDDVLDGAGLPPCRCLIERAGW